GRRTRARHPSRGCPNAPTRPPRAWTPVAPAGGAGRRAPIGAYVVPIRVARPPRGLGGPGPFATNTLGGQRHTRVGGWVGGGVGRRPNCPPRRRGTGGRPP